MAGSGSRADDHAGKVLGNAFWSKLVDKSSYKVFYTYQGWQGTIFPYIVTQKAYGWSNKEATLYRAGITKSTEDKHLSSGQSNCTKKILLQDISPQFNQWTFTNW